MEPDSQGFAPPPKQKSKKQGNPVVGLIIVGVFIVIVTVVIASLAGGGKKPKADTASTGNTTTASSTGSSSWETITCGQFRHDSPSQQQAIFNEMQSTIQMSNSNASSVSALRQGCGAEPQTMTLYRAVEM